MEVMGLMLGEFIDDYTVSLVCQQSPIILLVCDHQVVEELTC